MLYVKITVGFYKPAVVFLGYQFAARLEGRKKIYFSPDVLQGGGVCDNIIDRSFVICSNLWINHGRAEGVLDCLWIVKAAISRVCKIPIYIVM